MKKIPLPTSAGALLLACTEGLGLILITWFALKYFREPATAHAKLMFNAIVVMGPIIILYQMIKDISRFGLQPRIMLYGAVALISVLSVVGNVADDIVQEPVWLVLFASTLASCQLVKCTCQLVSNQSDEQRLYDVRSGIATVRQRRLTTRQDRRFIAAHEAGHALLYAAWSPFPDNLKVLVKNGEDGSNSLGYVNNSQQLHLLEEKTFAEWQMLLSLAGIAGERCYTGEVSLGAVSDMQHWLSVASRYLSCYPDSGFFYPDPASALEIEANQRHLAALKSAQNDRLEVFFEHNREVHTRLTDTLLDRGVLTGTELHPYLASVQLPEHFPRLHNPGVDTPS